MIWSRLRINIVSGVRSKPPFGMRAKLAIACSMLPAVSIQAGETVLSADSTTGRLLILKEGKVSVEQEGVEIARVMEPGAVFGELSVLLDQPHTADVRALEASQFHVADAATILRIDPIALLYVATVLAQRLDSANRGLLELKRQFRAASRAASLEERSRRSKNCWAPRVPILCMPAILMTRLHPTHRGVERVALPLGPPLSRLAQDEERRCAGRKTRSRGRLGQQETAMNDDSRPGNRPNCSHCNAPDTERLYSGGGNSEFKSRRSSR
jgi:CRP/FNR family transcriptional regulator, cyclic AMP receptor protein